MRILMPNYEFPPLGGGAAPVTRELATSLAAEGHEVDVVTTSYGDLPRTETISGVTVHRVPALRASASMSRPHEMASYLLTGFVKARELFLERDHEVVLAHFVLPTGVIAYLLNALYGVPYYVTAHGSDVPGYNPDRFTALHRLTLPAWKRIAENAAAIVSPSEHLARLIRSASEVATVEVIPNGFDSTGYDPNRQKEERILLSGRLFERKGVQFFLDALATLDTDWDVVVTGEGPYKEALERRADRLGVDVTFAGWVERTTLEELLETSAIYVFPSSYENCPVALQEAMAAGCAIVASRYSGTGEVLGDVGLLVDPRDEQALATEIDYLLSREDRRQALGRAARNRIEREYGWDRITSRYEAVMNGASAEMHDGWAGQSTSLTSASSSSGVPEDVVTDRSIGRARGSRNE